MFGETEYKYYQTGVRTITWTSDVLSCLTVSRPMRILFSQLSGCLSTCDGLQQKGAQESLHFLCCDVGILLMGIDIENRFCWWVTKRVQGVIASKICNLSSNSPKTWPFTWLKPLLRYKGELLERLKSIEAGNGIDGILGMSNGVAVTTSDQ